MSQGLGRLGRMGRSTTRGKTAVQAAERIASGQHGALSRRQALDCGLTPRQIQRLVGSGRWRRAARGVYVVAGSSPTWRRRAAVAWLAGPPGTLLSHRTAAALHGLGGPRRYPK